MTNPPTDLSARIEDLRDEIESLDGATDYERMVEIALDLADAYMDLNERDDDDYDDWYGEDDGGGVGYVFESVTPVELTPPAPEPLVIPPGYEGRTPWAYWDAIDHPQTWDRLVAAAVDPETMVAALLAELRGGVIDNRGRIRAKADRLYLGFLDDDLRSWAFSPQIGRILEMVDLDIGHMCDLTYPHAPRLDISQFGWNKLGGEANGQAELLLMLMRRAVRQNSAWRYEGPQPYKVTLGGKADGPGDFSYDIERGCLAAAENEFAALSVAPYILGYQGPEVDGMRESALVAGVETNRYGLFGKSDLRLLVSHRDILNGIQISDLTDEFRLVARELFAKGITDTRVWRAVLDGMPLDYATAAFSEAA